MSSANTGDLLKQWARNRGDRTPDYRQKLKRSSQLKTTTDTAVEVVEALKEELPYAEQLHVLAERKHIHGVAFQSVAVAALQVLGDTLYRERQAASVAISMAQRESLQGMINALESVSLAIRSMLNSQGRKMLHLGSNAHTPSGSETSWWFALTEAIETLEGGIDCITSIVSRQPKGGAARSLSSVVTRVLRRHQHTLLAEADDWMGT